MHAIEFFSSDVFTFFQNNKFRAIKFSHRLENLNLTSFLYFSMCVSTDFLSHSYMHRPCYFRDKSFVILCNFFQMQWREKSKKSQIAGDVIWTFTDDLHLNANFTGVLTNFFSPPTKFSRKDIYFPMSSHDNSHIHFLSAFFWL